MDESINSPFNVGARRRRRASSTNPSSPMTPSDDIITPRRSRRQSRTRPDIPETTAPNSTALEEHTMELTCKTERFAFIALGTTFLVGWASKKDESTWNKLWAVACLIYIVIVLYYVLIFLRDYYLLGNSPIPDIRELSQFERIIIASSYLLIDAVYPLSYYLLYSLLRDGT
jgi:hypothetical protein